MQIEITPNEKEFIVDYAKRFLEHKGGKEESRKTQLGSGDPLQYDIKGYAGEFILHKYFGVEMPDFDPKYTKRDMVLGFNGKKLVCDIKTTVYSVQIGGEWTKILTINDKTFRDNEKERKIDAFIAVEIDREVTRGEIWGIISWKTLLEQKETHTFANGGVAPCVRVEHLRPLGDDFTYIES